MLFCPSPLPLLYTDNKKRYNKLINDRVAAGRRIPRIAEGRIPRVGLQSIQYILFLAVAAAVYLHLPRRGQPPAPPYFIEKRGVPFAGGTPLFCKNYH